MNEAGNAKNIANYASYISIATTFVTVYKPPIPLIEITALQAELTVFETAEDAVTRLCTKIKMSHKWHE